MKLLTPRKIAAGAGTLVAFGAAVALAGTLAAGIGGNTYIVDDNQAQPAPATLRVWNVSANNDGMSACLRSVAGSDITMKMGARRVNGVLPEQSCTYSIAIRNDGDTEVRNVSLGIDRNAALEGWDVELLSTPSVVGAGTFAEYRVRFSPRPNATGQGSFTGAITVEDPS